MADNYGNPLGGQSVSFGGVRTPASNSITPGTVDRLNTDSIRQAAEKERGIRKFFKKIFRSKKEK